MKLSQARNRLFFYHAGCLQELVLVSDQLQLRPLFQIHVTHKRFCCMFILLYYNIVILQSLITIWGLILYSHLLLWVFLGKEIEQFSERK